MHSNARLNKFLCIRFLMLTRLLRIGALLLFAAATSASAASLRVEFSATIDGFCPDTSACAFGGPPDGFSGGPGEAVSADLLVSFVLDVDAPVFSYNVGDTIPVLGLTAALPFVGYDASAISDFSASFGGVDLPFVDFNTDFAGLGAPVVFTGPPTVGANVELGMQYLDPNGAFLINIGTPSTSNKGSSRNLIFGVGYLLDDRSFRIFADENNFDTVFAAVPLPPTAAFLGVGLFGLAFLSRKT